jgi:hypothetical protein
MNTIENFFRKVNTQADNSCWEWTGSIQKDGYGQLRHNGSTKLAHRYSYELFRKTIDPLLQLDHLCRNRKCVNPFHLEEVTAKENVNRGIGKQKTHCIRGHKYNTENTYYWTNKWGNKQKTCRICNKIHALKYHWSKK